MVRPIVPYGELADEGIYYWQWPDELEEDISELETIEWHPAMWQGPGWYQYRFDLADDPTVPDVALVQYLGLEYPPLH